MHSSVTMQIVLPVTWSKYLPNCSSWEFETFVPNNKHPGCNSRRLEQKVLFLNLSPRIWRRIRILWILNFKKYPYTPKSTGNLVNGHNLFSSFLCTLEFYKPSIWIAALSLLLPTTRKVWECYQRLTINSCQDLCMLSSDTSKAFWEKAKQVAVASSLWFCCFSTGGGFPLLALVTFIGSHFMLGQYAVRHVAWS